MRISNEKNIAALIALLLLLAFELAVYIFRLYNYYPMVSENRIYFFLVLLCAYGAIRGLVKVINVRSLIFVYFAALSIIFVQYFLCVFIQSSFIREDDGNIGFFVSNYDSLVLEDNTLVNTNFNQSYILSDDIRDEVEKMRLIGETVEVIYDAETKEIIMVGTNGYLYDVYQIETAYILNPLRMSIGGLILIVLMYAGYFLNYRRKNGVEFLR